MMCSALTAEARRRCRDLVAQEKEGGESVDEGSVAAVVVYSRLNNIGKIQGREKILTKRVLDRHTNALRALVSRG